MNNWLLFLVVKKCPAFIEPEGLQFSHTGLLSPNYKFTVTLTHSAYYISALIFLNISSSRQEPRTQCKTHFSTWICTCLKSAAMGAVVSSLHIMQFGPVNQIRAIQNHSSSLWEIQLYLVVYVIFIWEFVRATGKKLLHFFLSTHDEVLFQRSVFQNFFRKDNKIIQTWTLTSFHSLLQSSTSYLPLSLRHLPHFLLMLHLNTGMA
jgi:hypothetical protein